MIVEQDHRFIKRKTKLMLGFKNFHAAQKTLAGIELIRMIKKGNRENLVVLLCLLQTSSMP